MKSFNHLCLYIIVILLSVMVSTTPAADTPKKDAQAVLSEMRMKKFTKELELTEDQQKKVQAIFDLENKEVAKLNLEPALSITDKRAKLQKLQQDSYARIKPLLTPAQSEKFEKAFVNPPTRKKAK